MRKLSKVLVLLTLVICLSGCMKVKVEMDVKSSTEMTMKMDYLIGEEYFAALGTTQEKMIDEMKKKMEVSATGAKVTPKTETIDGKKWSGVSVAGPIKESEMKELLSEKEVDGKKCIVLTLAKDFMSGSQFGGMNPEDLTGSSGTSLEQMKALGLEMSITINMPTDATSNFGKVEGSKVTIDLLELSAKGSAIQKIEISSPLTKGFDMTIVLIGVGAIALLGIVFVMMKKKKTPVVEISENIEPIQETVQPQESNVEATQVEEVVQEATGDVKQVEEVIQEAIQPQETSDEIKQVEDDVQTKETIEPVQEATGVISQEPVNEEEKGNAIYCPNCGEKVSIVDTFCQKCGFGLKK